MTFGIRSGNKWYAWKERVDQTARALRAMRDRLETLLDLFAVGIMVAGFVVGVWLLLRPALGTSDLFHVKTLLTPSFGGLFLTVGLTAACFAFYRLVERTRVHAHMPSSHEPLELLELPPGTHLHDIAPLFRTGARVGIAEAAMLAERFRHAEITPLHLFIGALNQEEVPILFGRLGLRFDDLKESLGNRLSTLPSAEEDLTFSPEAEHVLLQAFQHAVQRGVGAVGAIDVLLMASAADPFVKDLLFDKEIDDAKLANAAAWIHINEQLRERYASYRRAAFFKPTGPMNRSMTSVATPNLDAYGEDLTTAAVQGALPLMIGREKEMEELLRVIEGGRESVVLVGPEGVGKRTLLAGIAERMVEERVPASLQDKRLVALHIPSMLSGVSIEQAQERLLRALVDAAQAKNIVLAIPDIDRLPDPLAALLVDVLERGITFAIATTTSAAYSATVERSVLGRAFQKVIVPEPQEDAAIQMLESHIGEIEHAQSVIFSYAAVEASVKISDRYLHDQALPDKAIEVAREAALVASKARGANTLVTTEDVSKVLSDKTGVPLMNVKQNEKDTLLNLEKTLHERVIGQEEAVKAVSSALRRARTDLRSNNRPISTFLFLGPTGVGKTELAKAVAAAYFGSERAMLRFDMSEFQDTIGVEKLIGRIGEGGVLTEAVRKTPFAIVLLDEFEKAHPDILNLFLQVFDDGRLTDGAGRTIDFTNTILVATSNAGGAYIQDAMKRGDSTDAIRAQLLEEELRGIYRPELLNRFDGVIVFTPLAFDDVVQIAYLMVAQLGSRLEPKGLFFRATDEAILELARKGFDPKFGARPLRRVVQEEVENAIAKALLEGRAARRDTIVLKPGGEVDIEKAKAL